jgi:hypothetical protein
MIVLDCFSAPEAPTACLFLYSAYVVPLHSYVYHSQNGYKMECIAIKYIALDTAKNVQAQRSPLFLIRVFILDRYTCAISIQNPRRMRVEDRQLRHLNNEMMTLGAGEWYRIAWSWLRMIPKRLPEGPLRLVPLHLRNIMTSFLAMHLLLTVEMSVDTSTAELVVALKSARQVRPRT